jgi:uncharacterized protein
MTSLDCQFLFKWGPSKLYGKPEYYQDVYVVGYVWAINIIASLIWLRFFFFGPFEWLWRIADPLAASTSHRRVR